MTSHLHLRIIDTPLVDNKHWRTAMVEKMARDLIRYGVAGDAGDSQATLRACSYGMMDIIICIDDARQAAFQEIVAREMAKP